MTPLDKMRRTVLRCRIGLAGCALTQVGVSVLLTVRDQHVLAGVSLVLASLYGWMAAT